MDLAARQPARGAKSGVFLRAALLSLAGMCLALGIAAAALLSAEREGALAAAWRDKAIRAGEVDGWLAAAGASARAMADALGALACDSRFAEAAEALAAGRPFVERAFVGLEDGRSFGAAEGWRAGGCPLLAAARAAGPGSFAAPAHSCSAGGLALAVAAWAPDLGGSGGAVVAIVPAGFALERAGLRAPDFAGYFLLIGEGGEAAACQRLDPGPAAGAAGLASLPGGEFFAGAIASGMRAAPFRDELVGPAYFMPSPLSAEGWTLAAVVPAGQARAPSGGAARRMALSLPAAALAISAASSLALLIFWRLTKTMEEKSVAEERLRLIFDNMPMASNFRDRDFNILHCNAEAPKLFGLRDKSEYMGRFFELSPERQPDGRLSKEKAEEIITAAFETGRQRFEWMHQTLSGDPVPCEVTLVRVEYRGGDYILAFVRDLRELYESRRRDSALTERLQLMLDTSPLVCVVFDERCCVLEVNREAERLFEIQDRRVFVERYFDFMPELQPDGSISREKALAELARAMETGSARSEWMYRTLEGKEIPCEEILQRVEIDGRSLVIAYTRDLRDFYRYKEAEDKAQQRLQAMLDSSPLACSILDEAFSVLEANQEILALFELPDRQRLVGSFFDLSPRFQPDGRLSREKMGEKARQALASGRARFEWMHQTLSGKPIPCEVTVVRVHIGGKDMLISYTRDLREINGAVAMVKQLEKLAFTDALTGASNRRHFMESAERELAACDAGGRDFSVVLFDIDHFKRVNDAYGHGMGDEVLKIIVARSRHALKQGTVVARYGGEEFAVMLPGVGLEGASKIAWQIQRRIAETPFAAEGIEIRVTVSLGAASGAGGLALHDIIRNADRALYRAKQSGRNRAVAFDPAAFDAAASEAPSWRGAAS